MDEGGADPARAFCVRVEKSLFVSAARAWGVVIAGPAALDATPVTLRGRSQSREKKLMQRQPWVSGAHCAGARTLGQDEKGFIALQHCAEIDC
jgi:hypothetical protein